METPITVFIDGQELVTLQPGESREFRTRDKFLPDRVTAFADGRLLWDDVVTWEKLEDTGFRYVIGGASSPTPPSEGDS